MRKNRFAAGALTLAVSMTICGCSQKMYDLTDTEEAAVINYAARAVTKFNLRQTEGIRNVAVLEKKMAEVLKECKNAGMSSSEILSMAKVIVEEG